MDSGFASSKWKLIIGGILPGNNRKGLQSQIRWAKMSFSEWGNVADSEQANFPPHLQSGILQSNIIFSKLLNLMWWKLPLEDGVSGVLKMWRQWQLTMKECLKGFLLPRPAQTRSVCVWVSSSLWTTRHLCHSSEHRKACSFVSVPSK